MSIWLSTLGSMILVISFFSLYVGFNDKVSVHALLWGIILFSWSESQKNGCVSLNENIKWHEIVWGFPVLVIFMCAVIKLNKNIDMVNVVLGNLYFIIICSVMVFSVLIYRILQYGSDNLKS